MPKSSSEETINHYGLVRLRIVGTGQVKMRLLSLDEVIENVLAPLTITNPAYIEPTRLSNLTQQRALLEMKTTTIDYTFTCSKIIIFAKQTATSWPNN